MFLIIMVVGLVGLAMMAVPALSRHGHVGAAHASGHAGHVGHAGHGIHHGGLGHGHAGHAGHAGHGGGVQAVAPRAGNGGVGQLAKRASDVQDAVVDAMAPGGVTRFLPSPRAVFSVIALYGAFANALQHAGHLPVPVAALVAVVPALLVERLVVRPVWNLIFRFQGAPSEPLEALVLSEAKAVTPFRNGKGVVAIVRDGRLAQLSARLKKEHAGRTVKVGDRLVIDEVDAAKERLTVSVPE